MILDTREHYGPLETSAAGALVIAGLTLGAAALLVSGMHDAEVGPYGQFFRPGVTSLALPGGVLALTGQILIIWSRSRHRPGWAAIGAVASFVAVVALFVLAADALRLSATCLPDDGCDSPPYGSLWMKSTGAEALLVLDLLCTGLVLMNAVDAYRRGRHTA